MIGIRNRKGGRCYPVAFSAYQNGFSGQKAAAIRQKSFDHFGVDFGVKLSAGEANILLKESPTQQETKLIVGSSFLRLAHHRHTKPRRRASLFAFSVRKPLFIKDSRSR